MAAKQKKSTDAGDQSVRFIEAAKKTGADETGKKFEKAFKKVVKASKVKESR